MDISGSRVGRFSAETLMPYCGVMQEQRDFCSRGPEMGDKSLPPTPKALTSWTLGGNQQEIWACLPPHLNLFTRGGALPPS